MAEKLLNTSWHSCCRELNLLGSGNAFLPIENSMNLKWSEKNVNRGLLGMGGDYFSCKREGKTATSQPSSAVRCIQPLR